MKFSLPSFDQIGAALLRIYKRFPFVLFVSVVGTVSAFWLAGLDYSEQDEFPRILALAFVSALGVSFQMGLTTFLEQRNWSLIVKYTIRFFGLGLLVLYWVLLGDRLIEGPYEVWYRYFLFFLAAHLFVAFAPFIESGKVDQFWEYNKSLFLRILVSVLYSGVLFVGLSIAILALDNLLELDIKEERYFQLFLFLGGIFNTWFFLTGVPEKEDIQSSKTIFPKGLKVFAQFVLIPLVTAYIFILYLYLGKIILEWELPNGWVSNLVLTFSIAGILSLLLLYPIRESKDHNWIRIYSKGYYLALIPLIGLLMFSIWVRISEYGVTVNRFYVATLGVWLTGIVVYFIFSKAKSIKIIPMTLCLIVVAVSFGPLGAFAVSERSQLERFEEVLNEYGYLDQNKKAQNSEKEIPFEQRKELSSVTNYVAETHGTEYFETYFEEIPSDSITNAQDIFKLMKLDYVGRWQNVDVDAKEQTSYYFSIVRPIILDVSEYDILLSRKGFSTNSDSILLNYKNSEWKIEYDFIQDSFVIKKGLGEKKIEFTLKDIAISVKDHNIKTYDAGNIPRELMILKEENEDLKIAILFISLKGEFLEESPLTEFTADILIKEKQ